MTSPILSVCLITYNQEAYIGQCIEGALMQRCSFDFEIVINDDCSTDSTGRICVEYASRFPGKIRYIRNEKNLGMVGNWVAGIQRCKGKYIALCEGDDYFTDAEKFTLQVEVLESQPDVAICFHRARLEYAPGIAPFYRDINADTKESSTLDDLVTGNYIHTPTCIFRKTFDIFPSWYNNVPTADWALHMLNAEKGKLHFIDREMAVYRIHTGGVLSTRSTLKQDLAKMEMYGNLARHFAKSRPDIARMFRTWHYHQKAYYYGIQNVGGQGRWQRSSLLLSSSLHTGKPKLALAAAMALVLPGEQLKKLWQSASDKTKADT